ncbi:MAG: hypothetical protein Q9218_002589 [Villophora microphyllina]
MLESGQASVKDVTTHGLSLLHTASGLGLQDLVRFLIGAGADVNASDEDGDTPLHRATSRRDNSEVARLLIEHGADLASVAVGNRTALHSIFNNTIGKILNSDNVLSEMGPDSEAMSITHYLAWSRHTTPEDFQRGRALDTVEVWAADKFGRTCLHYAALKGNVSLLPHLLKQASPVELEVQDVHGMTSLHCAARSSRAIEVMGLLLAEGANVDARDANGDNILDHAARWGRKAAVEQLLAR